jgi:hypothetical protein
MEVPLHATQFDPNTGGKVLGQPLSHNQDLIGMFYHEKTKKIVVRGGS